MLYLVGQWVDEGPWHVQGIFTDEADAISACRTEKYFVMHVEENETLPHEEVPSVCYYPCAL